MSEDAIKPVRRIVTIDDDEGKSLAIADGPSPDVSRDPARPGFFSARIWVTDASPVPIGDYRDAVTQYSSSLEPPHHGSVYRILTLPPDASFVGKIGRSEVEAFFRATGSPQASTYAKSARHPYMQKTRTLDFCLILEGEVTLVLDTEEVHLKAGDTIIQRGTNHAWSNRSDRSCRIAISSHDAGEV
jgi:mannose-6-phosphate isomerase-like protein (cupin superfamily)